MGFAQKALFVCGGGSGSGGRDGRIMVSVVIRRSNKAKRRFRLTVHSLHGPRPLLSGFRLQSSVGPWGGPTANASWAGGRLRGPTKSCLMVNAPAATVCSMWTAHRVQYFVVVVVIEWKAGSEAVRSTRGDKMPKCSENSYGKRRGK